MSEPQSFGPKVIPPVAWLGCLLAGALLDRLRPLSLQLESLPLRLALGGSVLLLAVLLVGWGVQSLRRHRTTFEPGRLPTALVTSGPYRWSRNPLYLALVLALLGFALLLDSPWVLATLPLLFLWLDRRVVAAEERAISGRFGEPYQAYCRSVRRWL